MIVLRGNGDLQDRKILHGSCALVDEINRVHRQKAKVLYPDKNKSPNAHEQFILLTEVYKCQLIKY
jgi:hypothetical protein